MKDRWYGDDRDLVKWGVLLTLAERYEAGKILQVAYLRPSVYGQLDVGGQSCPLPQSVRSHFRDIRNIRYLRADPPVEIEVVDLPFDDRTAYTEALVQIMTEPADRRPWVIFLDPDTGLTPRNPGLEHVLDEELARIWSCMRQGDVLVVYQHQTNRAGDPWIEHKREQFEDALSLPRGSAHIASGSSIARDVALFYRAKGIATSEV